MSVSILTQTLYAVGRRGDRFTHYVKPSKDWTEDESICGIKLISEKWISRSGTGRACNACCSLASKMKPMVELRQPAARWMFGMGKARSAK
jgi:hypothetical protein